MAFEGTDLSTESCQGDKEHSQGEKGPAEVRLNAAVSLAACHSLTWPQEYFGPEASILEFVFVNPYEEWRCKLRDWTPPFAGWVSIVVAVIVLVTVLVVILCMGQHVVVI